MYTSRSKEDKGDGGEERRGLSVKAIIWIVVAILAVIWIVQNTGDTAVTFLFWDWTMSVWGLIIVSMAIGAVLGYFLPKLLNRGRED